jgi:hypothetical protein
MGLLRSSMDWAPEMTGIATEILRDKKTIEVVERWHKCTVRLWYDVKKVHSNSCVESSKPSFGVACPSKSAVREGAP